jgi:hypothetical protein
MAHIWHQLHTTAEVVAERRDLSSFRTCCSRSVCSYRRHIVQDKAVTSRHKPREVRSRSMSDISMIDEDPAIIQLTISLRNMRRN